MVTDLSLVPDGGQTTNANIKDYNISWITSNIMLTTIKRLRSNTR